MHQTYWTLLVPLTRRGIDLVVLWLESMFGKALYLQNLCPRRNGMDINSPCFGKPTLIEVVLWSSLPLFGFADIETLPVLSPKNVNIVAFRYVAAEPL